MLMLWVSLEFIRASRVTWRKREEVKEVREEVKEEFKEVRGEVREEFDSFQGGEGNMV